MALPNIIQLKKLPCELREGFNFANRKYGDWNNLCSRTDGSYYELSELTHIVLTLECNSKASFSK